MIIDQLSIDVIEALGNDFIQRDVYRGDYYLERSV